MEKVQARHLVPLMHHKNGARGGPIHLRDPADLVSSAAEFSHDVGDQVFVGRISAIFLGVENCLTMNHPAQIAGARRP